MDSELPQEYFNGYTAECGSMNPHNKATRSENWHWWNAGKVDRLFDFGSGEQKPMQVKKFNMPVWTIKLPNHAEMPAEMIASILGFKSVGSVSNLVGRNQFPQADISKQGSAKGSPKKLYWSVGLLRSVESKMI